SSSVWLQRLIIGKTSMADGIIKTEKPDFLWIAVPRTAARNSDIHRQELINLLESPSAARNYLGAGDELFASALGLKQSQTEAIFNLAYELNSAHIERSSGVAHSEDEQFEDEAA